MMRSTISMMAVLLLTCAVSACAGEDCQCPTQPLTTDVALDSGALVDAGSGVDKDAGSHADVAPDPNDAGRRTNGPLKCDDPPKMVYITPPDLGPYTAAEAGRVVRCGSDGVLQPKYLMAQLKAIGQQALSIEGPVKTWRIAYRTERLDGTGGLGSARIYVPTKGLRKDAFVVAAHGSVGHADKCAPSTALAWLNYLVLPALSRGFAVIAPDYAGLGTDGVSGYMHTVDTGHSVLDSVRAMDKVVPEVAGKPFVVIGHSQGGGAAIAAQALSEDYGPKGRMKAAVAFAPGYTYLDHSNWVNIPDWQIAPNGFYFPMVLYGDFANLLGEEQAGYAFDPKVRAQLLDSLRHLCIFQYGDNFTAQTPTVGALLDDNFEAAVKSCLAGNACVGPVKAWIKRTKEAIITPNPDGAKVLVIQGSNDAIVPLTATACLGQWLTAQKAPVQYCIRSNDNHFSVVGNGYKIGLDWLEAVMSAGQTTPCAVTTLPKCPWSI